MDSNVDDACRVAELERYREALEGLTYREREDIARRTRFREEIRQKEDHRE